MSVNLRAETDRVVDLLEYCDKYCDESGHDNGYADLTLSDLEYIAEENDVDFDELVAILRENF